MVWAFERSHAQQSRLWRTVYAGFLLGYVAFLSYSMFQQAWSPWELVILRSIGRSQEKYHKTIRLLSSPLLSENILQVSLQYQCHCRISIFVYRLGGCASLFVGSQGTPPEFKILSAVDVVFMLYWAISGCLLVILYDEISKVSLGHYMASLWPFEWCWDLPLRGPFAGGITTRYKQSLLQHFQEDGPQGIIEIRKLAQKAMGTTDVRVDVKLNEHIWTPWDPKCSKESTCQNFPQKERRRGCQGRALLIGHRGSTS